MAESAFISTWETGPFVSLSCGLRLLTGFNWNDSKKRRENKSHRPLAPQVRDEFEAQSSQRNMAGLTDDCEGNNGKQGSIS